MPGPADLPQNVGLALLFPLPLERHPNSGMSAPGPYDGLPEVAEARDGWVPV